MELSDTQAKMGDQREMYTFPVDNKNAQCNLHTVLQGRRIFGVVVIYRFGGNLHDKQMARAVTGHEQAAVSFMGQK